MALNKNPIGVFDSGIGGLTVYKALRAALPHEDFIYLGDTARLPYGNKGKAQVELYTIEAARALRARGVKFLVVACNTVSAQALDALQTSLPDLPFCGVISTGAEAAVKATRNGSIAMLATEGTVRAGVYPATMRSLRPDIDVQMLACPDLVTLAEQGKWQGNEAEAAVAHYLALLKPGYDVLTLACTHFPLLLPVLREQVGPGVQIIDSAAATAQTVAGSLAAQAGLNPQTHPGQDLFLVTAKPDSFSVLAAQFLGNGVAARVQEISIAF